jgi:hypothetical protein
VIEVAVNNGKVTLAGSVDQFWKKLKIEEIVSNVPGVYEIVNTLTLSLHIPLLIRPSPQISSVRSAV